MSCVVCPGCSDSAQIPVCRDGNGNPYCVNRTALCDGMSDCMNGEDEQFPYCPTGGCGLNVRYQHKML